jgi:hypothetical protein
LKVASRNELLKSLQKSLSNWYRERRSKSSLSTSIRKDCFQVRSNLLTDFRFTTHMNIMILN